MHPLYDAYVHIIAASDGEVAHHVKNNATQLLTPRYAIKTLDFFVAIHAS